MNFLNPKGFSCSAEAAVPLVNKYGVKVQEESRGHVTGEH